MGIFLVDFRQVSVERDQTQMKAKVTTLPSRPSKLKNWHNTHSSF